MWERLLCFFGLHEWSLKTKELPIQAGFPPRGHPGWFRHCLRPLCNKRQHWLPGYGGSEWGCWLNIH